jgi:uncharacterized protein YidB (DUF937 family)
LQREIDNASNLEAPMGLLDVLNGMQNGPRGAPQPRKQGESGGMSPMMMALLALLAYKAFKGSGSRQAPAPAGTGNDRASLPQGGGGLGDLLGGMLGGKPGASAQGMPAGAGGLGDLLGGLFGGKPGGAPAQANMGGLGGLLGGLLAGGAAGSVLGSGLDNLLKDMQSQGYGNAAQSWVGTGPNQMIPPGDLESALGADTLDALASQTGMSRSELLQGLSQQLPEMVDQLTPDGRLPTEQEMSRWV